MNQRAREAWERAERQAAERTEERALAAGVEAEEFRRARAFYRGLDIDLSYIPLRRKWRIYRNGGARAGLPHHVEWGQLGALVREQAESAARLLGRRVMTGRRPATVLAAAA